MPSEEHGRRTSRWEYVKSTFGGGPQAMKEIAKQNVLFLISLVVIIPLGSATMVWILSSDMPHWAAVLSSGIVLITTVTVTIGLIFAEVEWKVDKEFGHHER